MEAIRILKHAVRQVFGNLPAALRISLLPYLLQVALTLFALPALPPDQGRGSAAPAFALVILVSLATLLVIAVRWHRFVLKAEPATLVPRLPLRVALAYLGRGLLILIVLFAVALPLAFAGLILVRAGLPPLLIIPVSLFLTLLLCYVTLRLSISLPAMAIGAPLSLAQGWRALRPHGRTLIQLSFGVTLLRFGFDLLNSLPGTQMLPVVSPVIGWVAMMLGLSLLTTLYGHFIERRPLA